MADIILLFNKKQYKTRIKKQPIYYQPGKYHTSDTHQVVSHNDNTSSDLGLFANFIGTAESRLGRYEFAIAHNLRLYSRHKHPLVRFSRLIHQSTAYSNTPSYGKPNNHWHFQQSVLS